MQFPSLPDIDDIKVFEPLVIGLCTEGDLIIFTNGSNALAGTNPVTAGWGILIQSGILEATLYQSSGPLITPESIVYNGQLKPSINTAELQAIRRALQ